MSTPYRGDAKPAEVEYAVLSRSGASYRTDEHAVGAYPGQGVFVVVSANGGPYAIDQLAPRARDAFDPLAPAAKAVGGPVSGRFEPLVQGVLLANEVLFRASEAKSGSGMACLSALRLHGDWASVVHVGNCRVGRLRAARFEWLTNDHAVPNEMVQWRDLTDDLVESCERFADVPTRCVGAEAEVAVDVQYHRLHPGDVFLLCSSGVWLRHRPAVIKAVLMDDQRTLDQKCATLVEGPLLRNASAVVVRMVGPC